MKNKILEILRSKKETVAHPVTGTSLAQHVKSDKFEEIADEIMILVKEHLELAYYAGQTQANAEWNNACSSSIGYRNERADDDFDSWYAETYPEKKQ
jgi:hypothetical protein